MPNALQIFSKEGIDSEMGKTITQLDSIKEELSDAMESAKSAQQRLEKAQSALDKVGLSGVLDGGIAELENHINEGESFRSELMERIKEADDISKRLDMIWSSENHEQTIRFRDQVAAGLGILGIMASTVFLADGNVERYDDAWWRVMRQTGCGNGFSQR